MSSIKKVRIGTTDYEIEPNGTTLKTSAQTFTTAQKTQIFKNIGLKPVSVAANLTHIEELSNVAANVYIAGPVVTGSIVFRVDSDFWSIPAGSQIVGWTKMFGGLPVGWPKYVTGVCTGSAHGNQGKSSRFFINSQGELGLNATGFNPQPDEYWVIDFTYPLYVS